jgi:predicted ATPase/DNA-binding XRE family transcriptional regulator
MVSAEPLSLPSFGPLLKRYRTAAGLTQEELAARAGLSTRAISDLERGVKQTPRRETVRLLAEALALPPRKRQLLEAAARPMMVPTRATSDLAPALSPHNLPAQLTPLIGRERETLSAQETLGRAEVRLLTLTGTGGAGKTRLALQVAEDALGRFEDGVYVVPLAPLRDPALLLPSIAETLGLRATPDEPLPVRLWAFLRDRQMLLVLDNFEHLIEAAPHVTDLLAACPHVKMLVTSREPLRLAGEHVLPVEPLAEEAASELFLRRARAAHPALELTTQDRATIGAICQRVDRLPLAIELAAVWVRVLPLPDLLDRLSTPLTLLTAGRRDAPSRHQTLRETIAWSEELLSPEQQRLFCRLAVFAGGCDPLAVDAICDLAGKAERVSLTERAIERAIESAIESVLDGLAALVEKSLLHAGTRAEAQDGPRFWMLDTIHEYARARLAASGEAETVARRHAEYYAALARELGQFGPQQEARERRLEREQPNMRAALAWARERREARLGLRLAVALGRYWYSHGAFDEGEGWLRDFLALDAAAGEAANPPALRVMARYSLILFALDRHDYDRAEALAHEGLALARHSHDTAGIGNMLTELGHVAEARGDLDAAMRFFEDGLAEYQAGGHGGAVGRALSSLGNLARARGEYARARDYLEQSLAWARERHFSWAVASGLASLGHVAVEQDDLPRARTLYQESLEIFRTMRNPAALAWCLEGVVAVVEADGQHERAARLCGVIAGLRQAVGMAETAAVWPPFARSHAATREALSEEAFDAAYAAGAALPPERVIAEALASMSTTRRRATT